MWAGFQSEGLDLPLPTSLQTSQHLLSQSLPAPSWAPNAPALTVPRPLCTCAFTWRPFPRPGSPSSPPCSPEAPPRPGAQVNSRGPWGGPPHLWYCAWRNWNSSLMRSQISKIENLKGWPDWSGVWRGLGRDVRV